MMSQKQFENYLKQFNYEFIFSIKRKKNSSYSFFPYIEVRKNNKRLAHSNCFYIKEKDNMFYQDVKETKMPFNLFYDTMKCNLSYEPTFIDILKKIKDNYVVEDLIINHNEYEN